ncbi:hypothetical protein BDF20DRAFT_801552, partial [Mycotypha africana]|uniref:uncharacterized protein n=1 Tax=Mycotypha africana TaxID=64632 RepID=UPI0022FFF9C1
LKEKFPGFTVSTAVLQKHIKAQCSFFLRRIERLDALASRTDMDTMSVVSDWIDSRDIDFFSNTVFVGQATFNKGDGKNMDDEEADKGAGVYQPSTSRGTVITLFGAISPQGLIDVNIQKPQLSDAYDTYHHQQFQNLPHVKQLIRGCYIVMDESMVICPHFFKTVIVDGGFRCAFYPNMANVADPMERFWARTRTNLDRS